MRIKRIISMTPKEIVFRGRQEISKAVERYTLAVPSRFPVAHSGGQLPAYLDSDLTTPLEVNQRKRVVDSLAQQVEYNTESNMFAGAGDASIADLIAHDCAEKRMAVIASADAICRGEFDILGYGKLSFRPRLMDAESATSSLPIDWHLDPISGRRCRALHWSSIDPLDREQTGDSKVVWELNRHQWLLDLGQAWQFTREERYADVFSQLLRDWDAKNPPGIGINWTSALEVSMRMISWCWALVMFRGSAALSPSLIIEMRAGIRAHAAYVERYISRYFSPNTHLTGEALGLFYIGVLFPDMKEASRWRSLGQKILEQEIDRQVLPDGVYFEQSTCYQYYTIEIYLQFLILAEQNRITVAAQVKDGLSRLLDYALALRSPNGSLPAIGDSDGGWLLPLVRRQPGDFRGLFSTAAAVLRRNDLAWAASAPCVYDEVADAKPESTSTPGTLSSDKLALKLTPELLWLLGPEGRSAFLSLDPQPPLARELQLFPQGGYAVMRNHWGQDGHQLIFDAGPLGAGGSAGHGHADLLSIQCSVFGEPLLIDAGTCCYTGNPMLRNYFRSTSAHSTVKVDGRDQAEPAGAFSWRGKHPAATILQHSSQDNCVWVDARFVDRQRPDNSITHRRRIAFIDKRYWVIVDELSEDSPENALHDVSVNFQFASLQVATEGDGWVRARGRKQGGLLLHSFSNTPLETSIRVGEIGPRSGWISTQYGQWQPAPALQWRAGSKFPLRILTLLYPVLDADAVAPRVATQLHGQTNRLYVLTDSCDEIQISDQDIQVGNQNTRVPSWE